MNSAGRNASASSMCTSPKNGSRNHPNEREQKRSMTTRAPKVFEKLIPPFRHVGPSRSPDLADGSVRFISTSILQYRYQAMSTYQGREKLEPP
jgi:hypothetical protein